ncbi:Leucine rich repeat containing protein BspA family protein [Entamoeba marina]
MMIASKYFEYKRDYINMICVNSKFKDTLDKFHYNPIAVQNTKLFKNMETQHLHTKKSVFIIGMHQYIIWYQVSYETFKQNQNKNIIFKRIRCSQQDRINNNGEIPNDCNILYDTQTDNNWKQELIIPQSIIYIFLRCFQYNESIKFIKFSSNIHSLQPFYLSFITSIGNDCFSCCYELNSITFTKHLKHIGTSCFKYCTNLTNIKIKEQVTQFNCQVPYFISKILSNQNISCVDIIYTENDVELYGTTIPNICTKWKNSLFIYDLVIPDTIQEIGSRTFEGCTNLTSINISNNVTSIGKCCFKNCKKVTIISLPNKLKELNNSVFELCTHLKEIVIPNNFYRLGKSCFQYCSSLVNITLSSNLQRIENNCFHGCTSLIEMKLPSSVTFVGNNCFKNCKSLTSLTLSFFHIVDGKLGCSNNITKIN